jgi:two-component system, chemotaxis family, protein-glutamate methylesterase/glutaminase
VKIAKEINAIDAGLEQLGTPSSIACPECHGVLLQLTSNGILRFRCHTGHAYSAETLVSAIDEGIEMAVWSAVRALEEGQILLEQFAEHTARHDRQAADALMSQSAKSGDDADAGPARGSGAEGLEWDE